MKRLLKLSAVMALFFSLHSCGLPGAVARSAGRAYDGLDRMAASAND